MKKYVTREEVRKSIEESIDCISKDSAKFIFEEKEPDYLNELDSLVSRLLVNKLYEMKEKNSKNRYVVLKVLDELDKTENEIQKKIDELLKPF